MKGLTFIEPDGTWGIVGMNESNKEQKMYSVACKLRDYERTGLQPDEVERLRNSAVDLIREKLLEKQKILQEKEQNSKDSYQDLLTLKEIGEINTVVRVLDKIFDNPAAGMNEEYNNGWIPFKTREPNEEEKQLYGSEVDYIHEGILPEQDEKILVTYRNGNVGTDIFRMDGNECYLESGWDIEIDAVAWKPLPEPYKEA